MKLNCVLVILAEFVLTSCVSLISDSWYAHHCLIQRMFRHNAGTAGCTTLYFPVNHINVNLSSLVLLEVFPPKLCGHFMPHTSELHMLFIIISLVSLPETM